MSALFSRRPVSLTCPSRRGPSRRSRAGTLARVHWLRDQRQQRRLVRSLARWRLSRSPAPPGAEVSGDGYARAQVIRPDEAGETTPP